MRYVIRLYLYFNLDRLSAFPSRSSSRLRVVVSVPMGASATWTILGKLKCTTIIIKVWSTIMVAMVVVVDDVVDDDVAGLGAGICWGGVLTQRDERQAVWEGTNDVDSTTTSHEKSRHQTR